MSLINQMLRDLDQRRASELEREGISKHVRTLPPVRAFPWSGVILAFAGACAGALLVWAVLKWQAGGEVPGPAAAAVLPSATSGVTAESADPAPPQAAPETTPADPAPARAEPGKREGLLRLDRSLSIASVPDPSPIAGPPAGPAPPAPAAAARFDPESAASSARIEKQPRSISGSEAADAEYRKGMAAIKRGSTSVALVALRSALQIEPLHALARQALLSLLVEQNQLDEALNLGRQGLEFDPKQTGWAMLVARIQVERGDLAGALETLGEHAKYAERNAAYLGFQALLLQKSKRYQDAADRYRAALAVQPNEGRWWYGLGLALESAQRVSEAREAYTQARSTGNLPPDLDGAVEQKLK